MSIPYYKVTVTLTQDEETEVGRQYKDTGKKDEKGDAVWEYTPSLTATKPVPREVFSGVSSALDLHAPARLIARCEKAVPS